MQFENVQQALALLDELEATQAAYNHAMGVLGVDAATVAPQASAAYRGKTMAVLSGVIYGLVADPKNLEVAAYLLEHRDELNPETIRRVQLFKKECEQLSRIPQEEYVDYQVLLNDADGIWRKAKSENDFESFAPVLQKIIDYSRKFAGYYNAEMEPYNALLNEYEEGLTMETLDVFFKQLREAIVPVIHAVAKKPQIEDAFINRTYPVNVQRDFSHFLMQSIGMDETRCTLSETEHPFTSGFNTDDVRITTHYYENDVASSMFSVLHEGGHAIYDMGYDPRYNGTVLGSGFALSIHESQSRFYENIIGRSEAYIRSVFPKMQEFFPEQLSDVTAEMMYRAVNKAEPSLIRIEADELTYALHIMVRYEIEKKLITGELAVKELPQAWNAMVKEYLGIDVPDDARGCLQDTHWASGLFGYFPSYALGSAYASQMKVVMEKEIGSVDALIEAGEIAKITAWLGEHIHTPGSLYSPVELFERSCGKFDAKYYTDYLTEKFSALYNL